VTTDKPRSRVDVVLAYHERTKNRSGALARSLGYVDWDTQPSAFRIYDTAPNVLLDEVPIAETPRLAIERGAVLGPAYDEMFLPGAVAPAKLGFEFLSQFLYDSLALAAWKQEGRSRWPLRVNPSNGNLHPTEVYLVLPAIEDVGPRPAIYHYSPLLHALEVRRDLAPEDWEEIAIPLPGDAFLVGLSTIQWREAWKYGERAFRYCEHDIGHAIGAIACAAASLGWGVRRIAGFNDEELALLLGIHTQRGPEAELPEVLLAIAPSFAARAAAPGDRGTTLHTPEAHEPFRLPRLTSEFLGRARAGQWRGAPSALSAGHHDWPILSVIAHATRYREAESSIPPPPPSSSLSLEKEKTFDDDMPLAFTRTIRNRGKISLKVATAQAVATAPSVDLLRLANDELSESWRKACADVRPALARIVMRKRRSAEALNARMRIGKEVFVRMLARTLPTPEHPVFTALGRATAVHLAIFVHRVREVPAGLYLLARDTAHVGMLKDAMTRHHLWKPIDTPARIPLYLLERGDMRALARTSSCHQALGSDSAFTVAMLAHFEPLLRDEGAPAYRGIHWEAGAIGQMLYLEAEAASLRGSGIGNFLDDVVHESLGTRGRTLQVLYHFAVGTPTDDARISLTPPYAHRREMIEH
jgi:SagB-type dehydrogenase family enzyme